MNDAKRTKSESADPKSVKRDEFTMQHCLLTQHTNKVLRSGKETQQALRHLRQSLLNCETCSAYEECELREEFNLQVDIVIAEINEEWGW